MREPELSKSDFRGHDRWLTLSFVLGPTCALTNLMVSYALVPESCVRGSKALLHASAAGFFALCLIGAALAWRIGRRFAERDAGPLYERARWLAVSAAILCIASAVIIIAMEIPNVILRSCD
jgi:hypothetical protein